MDETEQMKIMCTEIFEMLKLCRKDKLEKIPKEIIEALKYNKLDNYKVNIDSNKMMSEQDVSEDAKNAMYVIWRKYWATENEAKEFDNVLDENQKAFEEKYKFDWDKINQERAKYKQSMLAKQQKKENFKNANTQLTEYKKDKWYNKLFSFIKKIFKK